MTSPSSVARVLVVHEDPTMVLMLRRAVEAPGRWELTGARSASIALDRLAADGGYEGVILSWQLPEHGALMFLLGLAERELAPRPWVFGLHGQWTESDLARGLQAGVDGFLTSPITAEGLASEADGLREYGETPTRARLVTLAGDRLMREDERLWDAIDDPQWRIRMTQLATERRERATGNAKFDGERMLARLDALFGQPVGPEVVRILKAQVEKPSATSEEIARQIGAESLRVRAYLGVMHEMFATGNPRNPMRSEARAALAHAQKAVETRPDTEPASVPEFKRLKALAAELLARGPRAATVPRAAASVEAGGSGAVGEPRVAHDARTELCRKVAGLLNVPVSAVLALNPAATSYVAAGLLQAKHQGEAIDRARLAVLQNTLSAVPAEGPVDPTQLRTLGAALGVVAPFDAGVPPRLLQLAATLSPEPGIEEIDAARLIRLESALQRTPELPGIDLAAMRARLAWLRLALDPGAAVDLQRVARLVDAWDAGAIIRAGLSTVGAVVRTVERGRHDETVKRLFGHVGVEDDVTRLRLVRSAALLREQRPVPPLDTLRLLAIFQRAIREREPPSAARLRALVQEVDMMQAMERVSAGRPADVPPGPGDRTRVEAHLIEISGLLGETDAALGLPPAQIEHLAALVGAGDEGAFPGLSSEAVLRLRVIAAALGRPGQDPEPILRKVLESSGRDVRTLLPLSAMLGDAAQRPARDALRGLVGLGERGAASKDVEGHLAHGRLEAAVLATADLPDSDPRIVGLLNEAALALRTLGRGAEAEPLLVRALRIAPTRLNLLYNTARMLFEAGRDAECIETAERCRRLAPDFVMAEALSGAARARLGAQTAGSAGETAAPATEVTGAGRAPS